MKFTVRISTHENNSGRRNLVAQSSGTTNRMHDPYLTEKDNHQLSGSEESNALEEIQDAVEGAAK